MKAVRKKTQGVLAGLVFLLAPNALLAVDIVIRVVDQSTGNGVPDAQVIILETRQKEFSDRNGEARFSVPAPGFFTVRAIDPDGNVVQPRVEVRGQGQVVLVLFGNAPDTQTTTVQPGQSNEGEIQVRGIRDRTVVSRYQVRIDEIQRIPGQFGEALRGIENLPGITAPPFGSGEIVIRGANENANTYLLDDLPLGYAFHFFPVNSVLHNDFVQTIDLYTGAYPANFGDATGGVVAIESIDEVERFGGHASFALWSANALFKGPIPSFGPTASSTIDSADATTTALGGTTDPPAGYWIGAVRGSYMHKTLAQFAPEGVQLPIYWDGQFKVMYRLAPEHVLYFYALAAKDTFSAAIDDRPIYDPTKELDPIFAGASLAIDNAFHTEALRYLWVPGSLFSNRLTLVYHDNIFFIDGDLGDIDTRQKVNDGYFGVRNDIDWEAIEDHVRFELGGELRVFNYRNTGTTARLLDPNDESPDFFSSGDPDFELRPVDDSRLTQYNSGYGMVTLRAWGFEFKPGFRVEHFGLTQQTVVDPRGTLSYTLPWQMTLFGGAGVYHRVPEPFQYSPSAGNPDLRLERAEHYGGGIEQLWDEWTFKVEAYRHYYTDIVVTDPYLTVPFRTNEDPYTRYSQPILYDERVGYSNDGTGFSEGFEIYIKKSKDPERVGWFGWISYTWSRSLRNDHQHIFSDDELRTLQTADELRIAAQYDNTQDIYAGFDRTHIINLIFGYKFSREWQLGLRWRYKTGAPYTPIVGDDGGVQRNGGRAIFDPVYSPLRNSQRPHPYHQLDLRIDRFLHYEWGYGNFFVEMLNLYVRRNENGIDWDRARPISRTNPSPQYDFQILQAPPGAATSYWIPFFNAGVEVKF